MKLRRGEKSASPLGRVASKSTATLIIKHLDLFAGIGGFSLALQNVVGKTEGGFSEIDKYATQIYKRHFPEHIEYGDITAIQ